VASEKGKKAPNPHTKNPKHNPPQPHNGHQKKQKRRPHKTPTPKERLPKDQMFACWRKGSFNCLKSLLSQGGAPNTANWSGTSLIFQHCRKFSREQQTSQEKKEGGNKKMSCGSRREAAKAGGENPGGEWDQESQSDRETGTS